MESIKLTAWNIEHARRLLDPNPNQNITKRKAGVQEELALINPDIICVTEGPPSLSEMQSLSAEILGSNYTVVAPSGDNGQKGTQWIWFVVRNTLAASCSILPLQTWYDFAGGKSWSVNNWGAFDPVFHSHYRTPQVLILNIHGQRVEFIGSHLKSKFVNGGSADWNAGAERKKNFIREALQARVKLATEAASIRRYIDRKFQQLEKPAIFVLGDMNDGPGKEFFEEQFLFFDLISNIQGDIFAASRFLNHGLFDFAEDLRWTVIFDDFVSGENNKKILLDHILFTQPLVNWNLPKVCVEPHAGLIEHEIHDLVNSSLNSQQKTSDHRPVSLKISLRP